MSMRSSRVAVVFLLPYLLLCAGLGGQDKLKAISDEVVYEDFFRELAYFQERAQRSDDPGEREFLTNYHDRLLRLKPSRYAEIAAIAIQAAATIEELDRKAAENAQAAKARGSDPQDSQEELLGIRNKRIAAVREAIEAIRNSGSPPEFVYVNATIKAHVIAELNADRK